MPDLTENTNCSPHVTQQDKQGQLVSIQVHWYSHSKLVASSDVFVYLFIHSFIFKSTTEAQLQSFCMKYKLEKNLAVSWVNLHTRVFLYFRSFFLLFQSEKLGEACRIRKCIFTCSLIQKQNSSIFSFAERLFRAPSHLKKGAQFQYIPLLKAEENHRLFKMSPKTSFKLLQRKWFLKNRVLCQSWNLNAAQRI